jgi:integrase
MSKNRKRRGRGEGSIHQRADGLWEGKVSLGYDGNGKRKRKTVYGPTKKEVQEEIRKLQNNADAGMLTESHRLRLSDYLLTTWLEGSARTTIRSNTYASYKGVIENHIKKHVGGVLLVKLSPAHVQSLYGSMEQAGASPRMRQLAHAVLHRALKMAVKWNLVPRNVCDAVDPPRVSKKEMKVYGPEEVRRFLEAAEGDRLEALFVLAVTTGLRQGELFGLQWGDMDLDAGTIFVQRQLEEVNGKLNLTEPKSAKGRRRVELPAVAVDALWKHKALMLAEGRLACPVFCDTHGGLLRKSNFIRKVFKPLIQKANQKSREEAEKNGTEPTLLPDIRFHDLRHTNATLLLSQGVHPKVVQERLGHSQISLTLDTYSHVLPTLQKEAAAKLDSVFRKTAQ